MKSFRHCVVLATVLLGLSLPLLAQTPEWIWVSNQTSDNEEIYLVKSITLSAKAKKATLELACDDEGVGYVNGAKVVESKTWSAIAKGNAAAALVVGENIIAVRAKNTGSAAGVLARLTIEDAEGKQSVVVSDPSWTASKQSSEGWNKVGGAKGFVQAHSFGKLGVSPWGELAEPKKGVATAAESIRVANGFKIELIKSSQDEGSWVSMAIDPKGRLIISPQEGKGNILRMTLDANGQVTQSEKIDLPIGGSMGMLYAYDSLYVSGQGKDGRGLFRLQDTNGDDKYDKMELIKPIDGEGGEHGSHGLVKGPDGMIYYIHGNFVKVPTDIAPTSPHRNYAEDSLLPRGEDGNGFGVGIKPPGGFIIRGDKDGKKWEMVAGGMRNTYDFDFNQDGEMFAYDSDMEWDWGTPWYRPTRVYHLVSGGDYGFREGTAKYPAYFPDILPPAYDVGIGSPTGVKFGTGAKFSAKYQRAMYALDWSYGRISAVHLTPDGASYSATREDFVVGKPLNVTDIVIGKDGAMYFTTGGRGTQSGLYRVTYVGSESTAAVGPVQDEKAASARKTRHALEAFHGHQDPKAVDTAWPYLSNPDRWLRYAARIAIESQPVASWRQRALDESNTEASLTALLALARLGSSQDQAELIQALGRLEFPTLAQKLSATRVLSLSFIRQGKPATEEHDGISDRLNAIFPTESADLNREVAKLMIYLETPDVVGKCLDLVRKAETQEEQLFYIFALRTVRTGWTEEQRQQYFTWLSESASENDALPRIKKHPALTLSWFTDVGSQFSDGASYPNFLKNIRRDAVALLSDSEKGGLAKYITGKAKAAPAAVKAREFVQNWKTDDIAPSLNQVSKGRNFASGQAAYAAAQCVACHQFNGAGGAVGPDLTTVSSRFSRADILSSILDPSKVVSEQYENTTLLLKNDDDVTGRIVEENDARYVLVTDPLHNGRTEVKKSDVKSKKASKISPMPEGLANVLTKSEILDLLAYLETSGKSSAAQFAK